MHVLKETASPPSTFVNVCDSQLETKIGEKMNGGSANLTADELGKILDCYRSSSKYMGTQDLKTADIFYNELEKKLSTVWTGLDEVSKLEEITDIFERIEEITGFFKKANFPIVTNLEDHQAVISLKNHILQLDTKEKREEFLKTEIGFFSMEQFQAGIKQVITASVQEAQKLEIKKVVVAVPLGNHGGDTHPCNPDAAYSDLVCKSSLWVLAHAFPLLRDEFKKAAIPVEFLFFLDDSKSLQALNNKYVEETTTMRWNLLDATYSGAEAKELTTETGGGFIRTLIAVGHERSDLPMCKPESKVQSAACIRIGKPWKGESKPKIPYAKTKAAHFYVAWKCADFASTGWKKEVASNIIGVAPYAMEHSTLATK